MYHFLSGYTSKLAGTERGVTTPEATFSTCFGSPFLPLPATRYAEMLGKKITEHNSRVFLVNTGWTGGEYGTGSRMKLAYTRAMIQAALEGDLNHIEPYKMIFSVLKSPFMYQGFQTKFFNRLKPGQTQLLTQKKQLN